MIIMKTTLRNVVKSCNQQSSNDALNIQQLQRLALVRETAYTCIKQLQAGVSQHDVAALAKSAGIYAERTSGKAASTWNDAEFVAYGKQHGGIRVMHNLKSEAIRKGLVSSGICGVLVSSGVAAKDAMRVKDVYKSVKLVDKATRKAKDTTVRTDTFVPLYQTPTQGKDATAELVKAHTLLANVEAKQYAKESTRKAQLTRARKLIAGWEATIAARPAVQAAIPSSREFHTFTGHIPAGFVAVK